MNRIALVLVSASLALAPTAGAATVGTPPPKATDGHPVTLVAGGLGTPTSFAFGAGTTFAGDAGKPQFPVPDGGVFVLRDGRSTRLAGSPQYVAGLAWHQDALYISGGYLQSGGGLKFELLRWSAWNGRAFARRQVIYTAPRRFLGFNGIAFGPGGRLYVGAGVGPGSLVDHSPASAAPYLYDILSLNPDGSDLKVFASGIRQPWQLAFAAGAPAPLVSDLGQDLGATNPPDFLLKVRPGSDYGFPRCNHTPGSRCRHYAKPFRSFAPHTDIMGLAIIGQTLYMTSFLGPSGKAGVVYSMPLSGGRLRTVVSGFVAPVLGLGENAGSLYIGELTGQVFTVTP